MSNDTKFIDGLIVKPPHENAPEYVKAKLSIKRAELIAWLQAQQGDWINADIKESQGGKFYAAVDDWKPNGNTSSSGSRGGAPQRERPQPATNATADDFADDDIPFATNRSRF
jgi:hypothetical protein